MVMVLVVFETADEISVNIKTPHVSPVALNHRQESYKSKTFFFFFNWQWMLQSPVIELIGAKLIKDTYLALDAAEGNSGDTMLHVLSNVNAGKLIERDRILQITWRITRASELLDSFRTFQPNAPWSKTLWSHLTTGSTRLRCHTFATRFWLRIARQNASSWCSWRRTWSWIKRTSTCWLLTCMTISVRIDCSEELKTIGIHNLLTLQCVFLSFTVMLAFIKEDRALEWRWME